MFELPLEDAEQRLVAVDLKGLDERIADHGDSVRPRVPRDRIVVQVVEAGIVDAKAGSDRISLGERVSDQDSLLVGLESQTHSRKVLVVDVVGDVDDGGQGYLQDEQRDAHGGQGQASCSQ